MGNIEADTTLFNKSIRKSTRVCYYDMQKGILNMNTIILTTLFILTGVKESIS